MASLTPLDIRNLTNPRISYEERKNIYQKYCQDLNLSLVQLTNMMIYEYNVPEYLINMQLRDPKSVVVSDSKESESVTKEVLTDGPLLPWIDYNDIRDLTISSKDDQGRDDTPDDSDEIIESLMNAVKSAQHPSVTIKEFKAYGPMSNDISENNDISVASVSTSNTLKVDTLSTSDTPKVDKIWCHEISEHPCEASILHGMYKCECSGAPEMFCGACDSKISNISSAVRFPRGDVGGWDSSIYCNIDCAMILPPFELTPAIQLKFLVGIELMSRVL